MQNEYPKEKVYLITELGSKSGYDVEDPVKGNLLKYRKVLTVIESEIKQILSRFNK